eukprot:scaffold1089_cov117-Cylindrotheca_fusiformis.AAC.8
MLYAHEDKVASFDYSIGSSIESNAKRATTPRATDFDSSKPPAYPGSESATVTEYEVESYRRNPLGRPAWPLRLLRNDMTGGSTTGSTENDRIDTSICKIGFTNNNAAKLRTLHH